MKRRKDDRRSNLRPKCPKCGATMFICGNWRKRTTSKKLLGKQTRRYKCSQCKWTTWSIEKIYNSGYKEE